MRGKVFSFGDLHGGLNTRDSAYQVEPNQARDLLNVTGSVNGAIRKRDGVTAFATVPNVLNGALAVEATVAKQIIAADAVASVFKAISAAGAASSLTSGAGVSVGTLPWSFVQAPASGGVGPVYGMNGSQTPVAWDGGSTVVSWSASSGTLPNGKHMVFAANRLFVAGMGSYLSVTDPGSTLVFSDLGNPRAWPATNYVALDPNDGDAITGIGTLGPYLLVFKRKKVFLVYDLNTGANRRLADGTGCAAPNSIVETPMGTFFLSDRGVFVATAETVTHISDIITPTILSILPSQIAKAAAGFHLNHYYLSVCTSGGSNNVTLDFDLSLKSWWMHSIGMSQLLPWRPSSQPNLYGIDSTTGRVSRLFVPSTPTDYGAAFSAYWTGAWLTPHGSVSRHRLRQIRADLAGKVTLNLASDFTGAPSFVKDFNFISASTLLGGADLLGGVGTFGDPPAIQQGIAPTPSPSVARAFSLQWASAHTDPWQLEAFELLTTDRRN